MEVIFSCMHGSIFSFMRGAVLNWQRLILAWTLVISKSMLQSIPLASTKVNVYTRYLIGSNNPLYEYEFAALALDDILNDFRLETVEGQVNCEVIIDD